MKALLLILSLVFSVALFGCNKKAVELNNERFRLRPNEVELYIDLARQGDELAAKKLWLHFELAEGNFEKADEWKKVREKLQRDNKPVPTMTPAS